MSYLIAAYAITLVALAGYARSLQRGRARQVVSLQPTSGGDPANGGP